MTLEEFVKNNEVQSTTRTVGESVMVQAEKLVGVSFGAQLKEYIFKYGYLAFRFCELYGINSNENLESDLVSQTKYLHKYYPETQGYIAIENQGEGDYFLLDQDDNVFEYDTDIGELTAMDQKLFDYILQRFELIKSL
jgi:hypothetical protein